MWIVAVLQCVDGCPTVEPWQELRLASREVRLAEKRRWDGLLHPRYDGDSRDGAARDDGTQTQIEDELWRAKEEARHWMTVAAVRERDSIEALTELSRLQRILATQANACNHTDGGERQSVELNDAAVRQEIEISSRGEQQHQGSRGEQQHQGSRGEQPGRGGIALEAGEHNYDRSEGQHNYDRSELLSENRKLKKQIGYLQTLMIQTARQAPIGGGLGD